MMGQFREKEVTDHFPPAQPIMRNLTIYGQAVKVPSDLTAWP